MRNWFRSRASLNAECARLRRIVAEYEHCITWDTTCKACAHTLDASIRDYERAEKAEAKLAAAVKVSIAPLWPALDFPESYRIGYEKAMQRVREAVDSV